MLLVMRGIAVLRTFAITGLDRVIPQSDDQGEHSAQAGEAEDDPGHVVALPSSAQSRVPTSRTAGQQTCQPDSARRRTAARMITAIVVS